MLSRPLGHASLLYEGVVVEGDLLRATCRGATNQVVVSVGFRSSGGELVAVDAYVFRDGDADDQLGEAAMDRPLRSVLLEVNTRAAAGEAHLALAFDGMDGGNYDVIFVTRVRALDDPAGPLEVSARMLRLSLEGAAALHDLPGGASGRSSTER